MRNEKKANRKALLIVIILCFAISAIIILNVNFVHAQDEEETYIFGQPVNITDYCKAGQDFIVMVQPGSCQPAVVRSDLLEEQDVPVYCNLIGIKINPLINVPYIKGISSMGFNSSEKISGIGYYPARVYASKQTAFQTSGGTFENLGWIQINLKREPIEKKMPDVVNLNLSAKITYNYEKSFGIFDTEKALKVETEDQFKTQIETYSFWNGKGVIRAFDINPDNAEIGIYSGTGIGISKDTIWRTTLNLGAESGPVYMGSYCSGGIKIKLNEITYPQIKAILRVDGNEITAPEGKKIIDGSSCFIQKISTEFFNQHVTVKCGTNTYELQKLVASADFSVDNVRGIYSVGNSITKTDKNNNIYLAYIGFYNDTHFAVLFKTQNEVSLEVEKKSKSIDSAVKEIKRDKLLTSDAFTKKLKEKLNDESLNVVFAGKSVLIDEKNIIFAEAKTIKPDYPKSLEDNYENAKEAYQKVANDYTTEKGSVVQGGPEDYYGYTALDNAFNLAVQLGKKEDAQQFLELIARYYHDKSTSSYLKSLDSMNIYTLEDASAIIIDSKTKHQYLITLDDIDVPDIEDISTKIQVGGNSPKTFTKNDIIIDGTDWYIKDITENSITLANTAGTLVPINSGESKPVKESTEPGAKSPIVKVIQTSLKREAYVSITPASKNGETTANFTVQIGIEKRAIQLTPDQIKSRIAVAEKQIEAIEKFNNGMKSWIEGEKTACVYTQAALWAKTIFMNIFASETVMARKAVMNKFNTICKNEIAGTPEKLATKDTAYVPPVAGTGQTFDGCLLKHNAEITGLTKSYADGVKDYNTAFNDYTKNLTNKNLSELEILSGFLDSPQNTKITNKADKNAIQTLIDTGNYEKAKTAMLSYYTDDQVKNLISPTSKFTEDEKTNIKAFEKAISDDKQKILDDTADATKKIGEAKTDGAALSAAFGETDNDKKAINELVTKTEIAGPKENIVQGGIINTKGDENDHSHASFWFTYYSDLNDLKSGKSYVIYSSVTDMNGQKKSYQLSEADLKAFTTANIRKASKTEIDEINKNDNLQSFKDQLAKVVIQRATGNTFASGELAEAKLYDTTNAKGLPAIVPFTFEGGGYYVLMKPQFYDSSGRPAKISVYGVGINGFIEDGKGDDAEDVITDGEGFPLERIQSSQQSTLLQKGKNCLDKAISAATLKQSTYTCDGETRPISRVPYVPIPDFQCQNFMDPLDCSIMFNVCDPVICPSSRCNFGGRWTVANPIASGLSGSLVLCMPNGIYWGGDVFLPVCLSGIYASLQNYESMIKGYKSCLQDQLESGKIVGICDEMQSLYVCELVWREVFGMLQSGSLADLIGMAFSKLTNQQSAGGGEYLTFTDSLKSVGDTFSYMANYQSTNIMQAFKIKSLADFGTEVCKMRVSGAYPTGADLVSQLTKAESPTQFTASFDEISYSTVTVPPSSQYSISYHLYAGEDQGVTYSIYLTEPPEATTLGVPFIEQYVVIDSGYLPRGQSIDQKADKLLASGYRKLCVQLDGIDHCGFKQISSEFATDWIANKYLADQLKMNVTTEQQCYSGTSTFYPALELTNPTLATGLLGGAVSPTLEQAQPNIYQRGINRVCFKGNPSAGVNEKRWTQIGWCDINNGLGCWIDESTISGAIKDLQLRNESLTQAQQDAQRIIAEQQGRCRDNELQGLIDNDFANLLKSQATTTNAIPTELTSPVLFDFGLDTFGLDQQGTLEEDLTEIKSGLAADASTLISIEGWASPEGDIITNQYLSASREESVKQWLISKGVDKNKIQLVGGRGITAQFSTSKEIEDLQNFLCNEGYSEEKNCGKFATGIINNVLSEEDPTMKAISKWQKADDYKSTREEGIKFLAADRRVTLSLIKYTKNYETNPLNNNALVPAWKSLAEEFVSLSEDCCYSNNVSKALLYAGMCYNKKVGIEKDEYKTKKTEIAASVKTEEEAVSKILATSKVQEEKINDIATSIYNSANKIFEKTQSAWGDNGVTLVSNVLMSSKVISSPILKTNVAYLETVIKKLAETIYPSTTNTEINSKNAPNLIKKGYICVYMENKMRHIAIFSEDYTSLSKLSEIGIIYDPGKTAPAIISEEAISSVDIRAIYKITTSS